ncbi:MAG: hypothetical protein ABSF99_02815 [Anaerolineales bacterium]
MQKWEYLTAEVDRNRNINKINQTPYYTEMRTLGEFLQQAGMEGWEITSIANYTNFDGGY